MAAYLVYTLYGHCHTKKTNARVTASIVVLFLVVLGTRRFSSMTATFMIWTRDVVHVQPISRVRVPVSASCAFYLQTHHHKTSACVLLLLYLIHVPINIVY